MSRERAVDVLGVHEVGHPELLGELALGGVEVHTDDAASTDHLGALDDVEADATEAEHDHSGARLDLGRVHHRADARGDAAADVANLVERCGLGDLGQRDLGQHGEVRERRSAHVVIDGLAVQREPTRAVGHEPLALRGADLLTEVGLGVEAEVALAALGCVQRDDVVIDRDRGHARSDLAHDGRAPPERCLRGLHPTA